MTRGRKPRPVGIALLVALVSNRAMADVALGCGAELAAGVSHQAADGPRFAYVQDQLLVFACLSRANRASLARLYVGATATSRHTAGVRAAGEVDWIRLRTVFASGRIGTQVESTPDGAMPSWDLGGAVGYRRAALRAGFALRRSWGGTVQSEFSRWNVTIVVAGVSP